MKRKTKVFLTIAVLGFLYVNCYAQGGQDTVKVLFVGNSYTYFENMPQLVSVLSEMTGTQLIAEKVTLGGAKLSEHWQGKRKLKTREKIHSGDFDIVILQEWSLGTVSEKDSAMKYLALFSNYVREEGAKPYYYLTWAREKVPQQQETISRVYREAANQNDAVVVPVGEAWAIARRLRPDFGLYNRDGTHPSSFGAYLTACVFVAAITGELPAVMPSFIGISDQQGESVILTMIDQLDADFCREVALETVGNQ